MLVRRDEGRRHRGRHHAAAARARAGDDRRQGAGLASRCATRGSRTSWRWRARAPERCRTSCYFDGAAAERLEARDARGEAADFRERRHCGGRPCAHRVHLGHDRHAQGHDALPSRRDGRLRLLPAHVLRARRGRCVHRQPAARVHVRARRAAAVSRCASARPPCCSRSRRRRTAARGDPAPRRHRAASPRPPSYRAMAATWRGESRPVQPAQVRVRGRSAAAADASSCGRSARASSIIDGIGATEMLHIFISARRGACRAGRDRQGRSRATARASSTTRAARCRPARRPARREGPDRLPLPRRRAPDELREGRLEPTPATRTWSTTTATSATRRAPTT